MKSDLEARKVVMATEKKGYKFYQETTEKIGAPEAKKIFLSLAKMKFNIFFGWKRKRSRGSRRGNGWPKSLHLKRQGQRKVSPSSLHEEVIKEIGKYRSELSALKLGLEREESSRQLYLKAKAECFDEKGKAIFSYLAG
ncbi:MAG: hypothetical protein MUP04_04455 [Anaerolineae bacterium]|nr:hypothetical protein [Anaerolineae bacterium]